MAQLPVQFLLFVCVQSHICSKSKKELGVMFVVLCHLWSLVFSAGGLCAG